MKIGPYVVPVREAPPSEARPRTTDQSGGDAHLAKGNDLATISSGALERSQPKVDLEKVDRVRRQIEARELAPSPARIAARLLED